MAGAESVAFVIHTKRLAESVEFYCSVLGLKLVEEWTEGGHGAVIRLTSDADLELIELDGVPERHAGVALGLEVADVDAWYARVLAQGGTAKAPPIDAFGKRGFGTTDPNNVAVNVYTSER